MSGFLALGLIIAGLVSVALVILALDVARGDVGGHHTMERARRLLVVSTDAITAAGANRWIEEQRAEHPRLQYFVLEGDDDQATYLDVQYAIEQNRPDAVVVVRHEGESPSTLEGMYGRLKEDLHIPVDAIYVAGGQA